MYLIDLLYISPSPLISTIDNRFERNWKLLGHQMDDIYQGVALNKSTAKYDQTLMILLQSLEVRNFTPLFLA